MLVAIAVLLALVPAVVMLYPFLRGPRVDELFQDEASLLSHLERRWNAAVSGLKSAELERSIGNLTEEDYRWLRRQYMREAAVVLRAMELEEEQEAELLANVEAEIRRGRDEVASAGTFGGDSGDDEK